MTAPRKFRAPREDRSVLVEPPPERWRDAIDANRRELPRLWRALGLSPTFVSDARREVLSASERHGAAYLDRSPARTPLEGGDVPRVLLTGHQSLWHHAGVWFKNALLARHAGRLDCHPLNLVVDNDAIGVATTRCVGGTPDDPSWANVPFDAPAEDMPLEERRPLDIDVVRSFPARAAAAVVAFHSSPAIATYGSFFVDRVLATQRLGLAIAQTRHRMEIDGGWRTWDLPLSQACRAPAFARLARRVFDDAGRFASIHNACLDEHRAARGIRGRSHPVPALAIEASEIETPFWLWRSGPTARRRRAFLRRRGDSLWLVDRHDVELPLPARSDDDSWTATAEAAGIRLRPRALTTTLFARGVLGDLFVHGIGGAMYDQLLDEIVRRWLGVEPPAFAVASATFHAGDASRLPTLDDVRRSAAIVRRIEQQPDWALLRSPSAVSPEISRDLALKRRLIVERPPRGARKAWHEALSDVDSRLSLAASDQRHRASQEALRTRDAYRQAEILRWRETPLCFFPHPNLTRALLDLAACNA